MGPHLKILLGCTILFVVVSCLFACNFRKCWKTHSNANERLHNVGQALKPLHTYQYVDAYACLCLYVKYVQWTLFTAYSYRRMAAHPLSLAFVSQRDIVETHSQQQLTYIVMATRIDRRLVFDKVKMKRQDYDDCRSFSFITRKFKMCTDTLRFNDQSALSWI